MKTKRKSCLLRLVLAASILILILSVFPQFTARSGLEHALNLDTLPQSVRMIKSGGESWTDYLYVAVLSVDEDDCRELLKGRKFKRWKWHDEEIRPAWIRGIAPMKNDEQWLWQTKKSDGYHASCEVTFADGYSRVVVQYMSD